MRSIQSARIAVKCSLAAVIATVCFGSTPSSSLSRQAARADVDLDALPANDPGPEAWAEAQSDRERVFAAMREHLEPVEQMALWLRAYEGASVQHITRMLKLDGASGARGVLQTARRKLRAALGGDDDTRGIPS